MRLKEIEVRLAAIREELEKEGADVDALEKEINDLTEERNKIIKTAEKRKKLIDGISSGADSNHVQGFDTDITPEKKSYKPDTAEYRTAWLKNLQGRELNTEERAAVTASAAIPTETLNKIVHRLELNPLINSIQLLNIPGNITIPVESTVNEATWTSGASTDSADAITSVSLNAYKLIKTLEIGADVSAMAVDAFETWLTERLANKMEKAIDNAILNGTGSSQPTGILKNGEVTNTGTFTKAGMTYSDLLGIVAALPTQYLPNAKFVVPRALFYTEILNIKDDNKHPILLKDMQAVSPKQILGYEVIIDDNCPADTLIFGDFSNYYFNFAKSTEIKSDDSVGFRSGSSVWRAMALADGKVVNKAGFTVYTRAAAN